MSVFATVISVFTLVFLFSSAVGLFLAVRDIRKNKNGDNSFRKSRKERIKETLSDDNSGALFDTINNLSPAEQEQFRAALREKFNSLR